MAVRSERLLFIDNLRWSAISMVVVIHAAVTYSAVGSWYFIDHAGTGRPATIALATYQSFQHAVAMGLLLMAPARVISIWVWPGALAWKVSTHTIPEPATPLVPGGREATTVTLPGPSSRWISATAWPSRFNRSPPATLAKVSLAGS